VGEGASERVCAVIQPVAELRELASRALRSGNVPEAEAAVVVEALLEAELRGRPTHGLLRLPGIIRRFGGRGHGRGAALAGLRGRRAGRGQPRHVRPDGHRPREGGPRCDLRAT